MKREINNSHIQEVVQVIKQVCRAVSFPNTHTYALHRNERVAPGIYFALRKHTVQSSPCSEGREEAVPQKGSP